MSITGPIFSPIFSPIASAITQALSGIIPFNPSTLFSASDRGVILDFTQASNLAQLSTGGTPVASPGDVIGWAKDLGPLAKNATQATSANRAIWGGQPKTLGSELVTNPRFVADTDWTKGTGWSIASGLATKAAGTASNLSQTITLVAGQFYFVHFNMTPSAGTLKIQFSGGTAVIGPSQNYVGTYVEIFQALTGNVQVDLVADAAFAGTVGNVTIKPVAAFANMGAYFSGTTQLLATALVDMSNSSQATVIVGLNRGKSAANASIFDVGTRPANTVGSFDGQFSSGIVANMRGASAIATSRIGTPEAPATATTTQMLSTFQYDFTQPTIAQEAIIRNRGGVPTQTPSGAVAGSTTCVNGTVAIGNAGNGIYPLQGLVTRYLVINRTLNALEVTQAEAWAKQGMAYVGIIGDSTAALCNSTNIFFNVQDTASFLGNAISGAANITYPGDKIADQLAKWNALSNKQSLQAIIIQVGLNDANTYGGNGTKTSAQMIADLQGLVGAVNAQKPAACKVYICGMTPAKGWLGATTTPATAYAAWQDMNTAINGGGPTPITGVDARIMGQVAALNDGSDYLNPIYNFHADGVHPSNEGRFINAQYWRAQLVADGLIV